MGTMGLETPDANPGGGSVLSSACLRSERSGTRVGETEALRNAFRHAQAGRVEVEIRYDHERFRLRVRDDGQGIDPAVLANQGLEGHYGLRGMPERAALIGGTLVVWSEVGAGTEVELRLPASTLYATSRRRSWWARLLAPKRPANLRGDPS